MQRRPSFEQNDHPRPARGQSLALCIFGDLEPQWVLWEVLEGGALITTASAYQATRTSQQEPPLLWLTDQELKGCAAATPESGRARAGHARVRSEHG